MMAHLTDTENAEKEKIQRTKLQERNQKGGYRMHSTTTVL